MTTATKSLIALLVICSIASFTACGGGSSSSNGRTIIIGTGGGPVGPAFFSMHVNNISSPLPTNPSINVPVAGVRLWDTQTAWAQVETGSGTFNWTLLDDRVSQARGANLDVLYELARTPGWAYCQSGTCMCGGSISCANGTNVPPGSCAYAVDESTPGDCYPPHDLNADGTGSDQIWINWVTSVVSRYKGQIAYYEIWNEPNIAASWQGSWQQLARMAADARCIIKGDAGCNSMSSYTSKGVDPNAQLVSPAFTTSSDQGSAATPADGLAAYLPKTVSGISGSAAAFADVVAFHGYPGQSPPEQVAEIFSSVQSKLQSLNVNLPVFDTEGSWGAHAGSPNITDPDEQAAFAARYLMVQEAAGVARMYWYAWDLPDGDGTLWCPTGGNCSPVNSSQLTKAGLAYQQVVTWLSGATLAGPCVGNGSVFTCTYTRSGGYQALAVWDSSQSCGSGSCSTSSYTVPSSPSYTQYQDLAGNVTPLSGNTVQIGAKPILLETGNIP